MCLISIKTLKNLKTRIKKHEQNLNKEFCIGLHGEIRVGISVGKNSCKSLQCSPGSESV